MDDILDMGYQWRFSIWGLW